MMFWKILLTLLVLGSVDAQNPRQTPVKTPKTTVNLHRSLTQPLYGSGMYIANITVGTPPQTFRMLMDPMVDIFWIPDKSTSGQWECTGDFCFKKKLFDSSRSSTYKKNGRAFNETDRDHYVTGFYAIDTIGLGLPSLSERLVIPSVTFGQMTGAYKYYADEMFDGILGLPPSKLSNDGIKPVFRQAVDKKLVDKPMFTIWSRKPLPGDLGEQQPPGGQLTWGGLDTDHCDSSVIYTPLTSQDQWTFKVKATSIGNIKRHGAWSATVDSKMTTTIIPNEVHYDLVKGTHARFSPDFELYKVNCAVKFQWSATINDQGQTITIDERNGIWKGKTGDCFLALENIDQEHTGAETDIVFGGTVSGQYCITYDITGQIGFAKSKEWM